MSNRPNIIFILIDDMGWMDLACQGSGFYETPNIDRLAQRGMRFTNAYAAAPVCSPTRASLLTGRYPARVGVTDWIAWGNGGYHPCRGRLIDAPYINHLPANETSIAAALRDGGYDTWHIGKWHLGGEPFYPEKHGFNINIGGNEFGCPIAGYYAPWKLPNLRGDDVPVGEYLDDYLTDRAIRLIASHDQSKPFFLNLWHYLVHMPPHAKPSLIEKYERKQQTLGLDKLPTFEDGEHFPFHHKGKQRVRRRLLQSDPVYAAMVEILDTNIGRLIDALTRTGQLENTLIVFTSDNGGLATSEGSPTCNAPLCEGKGWMYEGGTRVPLLIAWPGVVAPGTVCDTPITSPDYYPTLLEVAQLGLMPQQHTDGVSLMPLLRGGNSLGRDAIYWHYPHYGNQGGTPGSSIRAGDWKLIEFYEDGRLELYNLHDDVSEDRNLASTKPDLVRLLHAKLQAWQRELNALMPSVNRDWRPPADPNTAATM